MCFSNCPQVPGVCPQPCGCGLGDPEGSGVHGARGDPSALGGQWPEGSQSGGQRRTGVGHSPSGQPRRFGATGVAGESPTAAGAHTYLDAKKASEIGSHMGLKSTQHVRWVEEGPSPSYLIIFEESGAGLSRERGFQD